MQQEALTGQIVYMSVDAINTAGFNPPDRTNPRSLRQLAASIAERGILQPLVMSIDDNCLADGHRRLAAAKLAHLDSAPVVWRGGKAAELWAALNGATEPIKGRDWWIASSHEIAVATNAPRRMSNRLGALLRVLGAEDYTDLASRRSPGIFTTAIRVANYVGHGDDDAFLRACLLWLDKHDQQRPVIDALKKDAQAPAAAFLSAIREDRPLRMRRVYE